MVNYTIQNKSYKPYHQESVRVKLVEGLEDGIILDSYMEKTIETLKFFHNIIEFEGIDYVLAVATSAVRDASNRDAFIKEIHHQTGLDFQILSEYEEALYSFTGAIRALYLPSVVFFDLGGGSLEIVSAENFKIKKIFSLPLGSLRLTQQFLADSNISDMRKFVTERLPTLESLGLSRVDDVTLVGVGGTLRTLAKYEQEITNYPMTKLHNYTISRNSLDSISNNLLSKTTSEISCMSIMGNGRSHTIQAGSVIISELVKKLGFQKLTVSAQGLREGTLALSHLYHEDFLAHQIKVTHVEDLVNTLHLDIISKHVKKLISLLSTMKLITNKEHLLLVHAIKHIDTLSSFRDVNNVLYTILDDDSMLSHREQLIVALSLIYTKKKRKTELLISKFDKILLPTDKSIIKKISSVVSLCDIFHKTAARVESKSDDTTLILNVHPFNNKFPELLLEQACTKMENEFNIIIDSKIYYETSNYSPSEPIGI